MVTKSEKKTNGNVIKWILAIFMFVACLVFGFSLASVIFALLGVYFLPIAPIQNFFNKIMPKSKVLRGAIAFVIFAIGCCIAPQVDTITPEVTNPTNITISTEVTSEPTTDITTETTINPTSEPTTGSTTPPATQPPATQPPETDPPADDGRDYVVNISTEKFHYHSCPSADDIKESNRWEYHGTREELINMGYVPCKRCDP